MFSLASNRISGRRILVIEYEDCLAVALRAAIQQQGGVALGPTTSIDEALGYIATVGKVDCVILDTRLASITARVIPDLFRDRGVETIFVTGHDDWFDDEEDDADDLWGCGDLLLATA